MGEERRQIYKMLLWGLRLAHLPFFSFFVPLKRGYVPWLHYHHLWVPHFPCWAEPLLGLLWVKSELAGRNCQSLGAFPFLLPALNPFIQPLQPPEPLLEPGEWADHGCVICAAKCYQCCGRKGEEGWALFIWGLLLSFPHPPPGSAHLGSSCNGLRKLR